MDVTVVSRVTTSIRYSDSLADFQYAAATAPPALLAPAPIPTQPTRSASAGATLGAKQADPFQPAGQPRQPLLAVPPLFSREDTAFEGYRYQQHREQPKHTAAAAAATAAAALAAAGRVAAGGLEEAAGASQVDEG